MSFSLQSAPVTKESMLEAVREATNAVNAFMERLPDSYFADNLHEYEAECTFLKAALKDVSEYNIPRTVSMETGGTLSHHWACISNALNALHNQLIIDGGESAHIDHNSSGAEKKGEVAYNKHVDEFKDELTRALHHEIKPHTDKVLQYLNYYLERSPNPIRGLNP